MLIAFPGRVLSHLVAAAALNNRLRALWTLHLDPLTQSRRRPNPAMPPKKSSKPAAATAADFNVGDLVLTKVKGYPEWPGKVCTLLLTTPGMLLLLMLFILCCCGWALQIIDVSSAPENIQRLKAGRPLLVRFYPDAD